MTPEEEQGLELAKEGVKDLLSPVTDVLHKLLGPAATEIGLSWGDSFRVWRLKRAVRLLQDVKNIALEKGLDLKPVAPRLLFPIVEAASVEDDEDLHQRWVALLSNAARADPDNEVLPSFPDILKQLTPGEARFLDTAYDQVTRDERKERDEIFRQNPTLREEFPHHVWREYQRGGTISALRLDWMDAMLAKKSPSLLTAFRRFAFLNYFISKKTADFANAISIQNLERLMILRRNNPPANTIPSGSNLYITSFGRAFIRACRLSNAGEERISEPSPFDA